MRILLLEDHEAVATATRMALETAGGATVTVASTLREADGALEASTFDLILADVSLPDGDGGEWAQEVRTHGSTPVALLTAYDVDARRAGVDGVLVKPAGVRELLDTVNALTSATR